MKVLKSTFEKRNLEMGKKTFVESSYYCKTYQILKDITTRKEISDIAQNKLQWEGLIFFKESYKTGNDLFNENIENLFICFSDVKQHVNLNHCSS